MDKLINASESGAELSLVDTKLLKGVAILLVIICHVGNVFTRFTTPLGGIGVAIFLFLSGYGLTVSYIKKGGVNKKYWNKRLVGVWIPYVLLETVTLPLKEGVTVGSFLKDIFLIEPQFRLGWYLPYLFIWYALFWVIHVSTQAIEKKQKRYQYNLRLSVLGALIIAIFFRNSGIRFEQSITFLMGIICAYCPSFVIKIKRTSIMLSLCTVSFVLLSLKQIDSIRRVIEQMPAFWDLCMKSSAAFGIIIFVLLFLKCFPEGVKKILLFVGNISFELYLVHGVAMGFFGTDIPMLIKLVLFFTVSFGGAISFRFINERLALSYSREINVK